MGGGFLVVGGAISSPSDPFSRSWSFLRVSAESKRGSRCSLSSPLGRGSPWRRRDRPLRPGGGPGCSQARPAAARERGPEGSQTPGRGLQGQRGEERKPEFPAPLRAFPSRLAPRGPPRLTWTAGGGQPGAAAEVRPVRFQVPRPGRAAAQGPGPRSLPGPAPHFLCGSVGGGAPRPPGGGQVRARWAPGQAGCGPAAPAPSPAQDAPAGVPPVPGRAARVTWPVRTWPAGAHVTLGRRAAVRPAVVRRQQRLGAALPALRSHALCRWPASPAGVGPRGCPTATPNQPPLSFKPGSAASAASSSRKPSR